MALIALFLICAGNAVFADENNQAKEEMTPRQPKAISFFNPYLEDPQIVMNKVSNDYADFDALDYRRENAFNDARARQGRPKPDSPVYYIRLPPSPYVLVPGMGYVSRPPQFHPPPVVQPRPQSSLYNIPINYVSNAKPTGVYTWKQDSPVTNLNKGPYVFNGRPNDVYLLQNSYKSLYENPIHNFYR